MNDFNDFNDPESEPDELAEDDPLAPDPSQDADLILEQLVEVRSQLTASDTESRRTARRVLEGLKGFSTALDAIAATTHSLHATARAAAMEDQSPLPSTDLTAALIALSDRLDRIATALAREPDAPATWWPGTRKAVAPWQQDRRLLAESFTILATQKNALLQQAGLAPIRCLGERFDPTCMAAVEVITDPTVPDHTVLAEILPGWRASGAHIVRFAEVRVSRQSPPL